LNYLFFFGAKFIYNLASEANQLQKLSLDELDNRIEGLICSGSEKVCLGIDRKVIKRGNLDIFGLKIINVIDTRDFEVIVSSSGGFNNDKSPITSNLIIFPETRPIDDLIRNGEIEVGIGIEVPKTADSGTYIFDVSICFNDPDMEDNPKGDCSADTYGFNKIYVEVP